mmetsp:Transcript_2597/g.5663  ORF Transcript_2597/g.5663 Transcript_2597/m.5663 type:complete len:217 (-) Transcript_2597:159-809(-)
MEHRLKLATAESAADLTFGNTEHLSLEVWAADGNKILWLGQGIRVVRRQGSKAVVGRAQEEAHALGLLLCEIDDRPRGGLHLPSTGRGGHTHKGGRVNVHCHSRHGCVACIGRPLLALLRRSSLACFHEVRKDRLVAPGKDMAKKNAYRTLHLHLKILLESHARARRRGFQVVGSGLPEALRPTAILAKAWMCRDSIEDVTVLEVLLSHHVGDTWA